MSRVTELAEAEAEQVEAENPDDPEPEETEPEQPAEPEPEGEPTVGEAEMKKANRAIEDQRVRLAKIVGQENVAHECLLCGGAGFVPELPPLGATLEVVEGDEGVTLSILSPGVPPDLNQAPDKARCPECSGRGMTATDSLVPAHIAEQCAKCNGNGWITIARDAPQMNYPPPSTATTVAPPNGQPMDIPADAWDRPYGHAHYGIPPSMVGS